MLKPIVIDGVGTVHCKHSNIWPPHWAKFGTAQSLKWRFNNTQYERARTWETVCGLMEMEQSKCKTCPHALKEDNAPLVPSLAIPIVSQRRLKDKQ